MKKMLVAVSLVLLGMSSALAQTEGATAPATSGAASTSGGASTGAAATGGAVTTAASAATFIGLGVAGLAAGLSDDDTGTSHSAPSHH